jgi:hypothetical protein
MMPCCNGRLLNTYPSFLHDKISAYELWCLDLAKSCNGNAVIDNRCFSKKNIIITASNIEYDIFDEASDVEEECDES